MIITAMHVSLLLFSAYMLAKYQPGEGCRYRPAVSLFAACWAGSCVSLAVAIVLQWPEAVSRVNGVTAVLAGASAVAAWVCRGDVAQLIRMVKGLCRG